jgi:hypothetical protein
MTSIIQFVDTLGLNLDQTSTKTTITASTSSILLLPAKNERVCFTIKNTSSKTMYISYSSPATLNDVAIATNAVLDCRDVKTAVFGIWAAAPSNGCIISEVSYDI